MEVGGGKLLAKEVLPEGGEEGARLGVLERVEREERGDGREVEQPGARHVRTRGGAGRDLRERKGLREGKENGIEVLSIVEYGENMAFEGGGVGKAGELARRADPGV